MSLTDRSVMDREASILHAFLCKCDVCERPHRVPLKGSCGVSTRPHALRTPSCSSTFDGRNPGTPRWIHQAKQKTCALVHWDAWTPSPWLPVAPPPTARDPVAPLLIGTDCFRLHTIRTLPLTVVPCACAMKPGTTESKNVVTRALRSAILGRSNTASRLYTKQPHIHDE
jgi:hypothetical protein